MDRDNFQTNNESFLTQVWDKYFPYWPVFLALMVLGCAGAWWYTQTRLPTYETSASLMIKDEKKGTEDAKIIEDLNTISGKKIIENEIEVIKSRAVLNEVVTSLRLYAPVFEEKKWNSVSAYHTSPISVELKDPSTLEEVERVDFAFTGDSATIKIDSVTYPMNRWITTPWGTMRFNSTKRPTTGDGKYYFSLIHPKRIVQDLIEELNVSAVNKLSSVLSIKLEGDNPKRSEDILNGIVEAYTHSSAQDKKMLAANTLKFIDQRLEYISKDLDSIEKKLQQYRSAKGAINISSQGELFLKNVSDNDQKLSDLNMKLAVMDQVEQYVVSKRNDGGIVPSTLGIDDLLLSDLLTKLYEAEMEYQRLKATTAENNPILLAVTRQIDQLRPSILENIRSQRKSIEASKRNLLSTNNGYVSTLQTLPQQERDLVEINRQHNTKSAIYDFLIQRREETGLSFSPSVVGESKVVDAAESSIDPVSLPDPVVYIIGILLAIGLATVIISVKDGMARTIMYRQELEMMTDLPVLGEISMNKTNESLVLKKGQSSYIGEQFRMLRTSLHYLGIGSNAKRVLVTSTIPGDGKSFVTANLGLSMAMAGKKVIIVEFDLSNPTLSDKLNTSYQKGLSDYLLGEIDIEGAIQKTGANPNLYFLGAGNLPDNPSDLILSEKVNSLLAYLDDKFDMILLDTAPVGVLADGYVLARKSDATLFVVRHGHTPKRLLRILEQNNQINELKNTGIVFNGVSNRGFVQNNAGYGYGYGYTYNTRPRKRLANSLN